MKTCRRCELQKSTSEFSRHPNTRDKLHPCCRACRAIMAKEDRALRREQLNQRQRERYAANIEDERAKRNAWRAANPDKVRATKASHYERNKESVKAKNARYRAENPHVKKRARLKAYGLTIEQFDALAAAQRGLCWICKQPPGRKGLVVDHCHSSGAVRGLLCAQCNLGMGAFKDDVKALRRAIVYLRQSDEVHRGKVVHEGSA